MKYHADIFMPEWFRLPLGLFRLKFTSHARQEARKDGVTLPVYLNTATARLFEMIEEKGRAVKLAFRIDYTNTLDLCVVVAIDEYPWVVVTCWVNKKSDRHATLNRSNYVGGVYVH